MIRSRPRSPSGHQGVKLIDIQNGVEEFTSKSWCSTKVDRYTKEHIGGGSYYGDCSSNCESTEEAAANLQSANQKNSGQFRLGLL